MTPAEVAAILRQFNEWRRGDEDIPQFDTYKIGAAIDAAVDHLDLLEAAEKERDAMRAELLDAKETVRELFHGAGVANMTITTLQARVEAMERQEPVAWYSKQYGFVYMSRQPGQFEHGSILYLRNGAPAWRIEGDSKVALLDIASLPHGTVFYTLPGAKGEIK